MFLRKKQAQAVLEYIIVLTALVAGFLLVRGTIRDKSKNILEHPSNASKIMIDRLDLCTD